MSDRIGSNKPKPAPTGPGEILGSLGEPAAHVVEVSGVGPTPHVAKIRGLFKGFGVLANERGIANNHYIGGRGKHLRPAQPQRIAHYDGLNRKRGGIMRSTKRELPRPVGLVVGNL